MGRQRMQGMEYFDHWTSANSDLKIKKLVAHYGVEGYGVYFYLLEMIYSQPDYCLDFSDEDTLVLLANEMKISDERLNLIIEKCLNVG
ncbi:MAG: DUF4373 domain-containing protein, partial [Lachnospiraceae bacterium]|nr:DUF4373 domain-containing protein [Lachnospiraceae bacterium]